MTERVKQGLLNSYIVRLNAIIAQYNPNIIVAHEVSGHNTLELCNYKDGSVTTVIKVLSYGTKRELLDQIGFYFEFQSQLERIQNDKVQSCDNSNVSFEKSNGGV